jgi:hypothetical protein
VPYCDTDDLLVGDVLLGPNQNLSVWVDSAAEEMDSKLGFRYQVPIAPKPPATILAKHELLLLKDINKKLASGRFLLAQAQGSEEGQEHAYGRALVNDALNSLSMRFRLMMLYCHLTLQAHPSRTRMKSPFSLDLKIRL